MTDFPLRRRADFDPDPLTMRALVVEDSEPYRSYVAMLVGRHGFRVTECHDGAAALEILREESFDLLVVDCEMPRMDGLALISEIRPQPRHSEIYAIMLTNREDIETKLAALRLGYDDFLMKSYSELEIVAKLCVARRLISRQRRLDSTVRELYGLATRDELTGLFNRRYFFAEAERMLAEGLPVNLVLFDLDDFKRINDNLGHLAGDRILRDLGSLFLRRTRIEDLVARYGGDEFVMIVHGLEPTAIEPLAHRLADELGSAQWTFGHDTFSIGVTSGFSCSSLLDRPTVSKLLSACDRDLYKNKWIRKHPNEDPNLYEYGSRPGGNLVELPESSSLGDVRLRDTPR